MEECSMSLVRVLFETRQHPWKQGGLIVRNILGLRILSEMFWFTLMVRKEDVSVSDKMFLSRRKSRGVRLGLSRQNI